MTAFAEQAKLNVLFEQLPGLVSADSDLVHRGALCNAALEVGVGLPYALTVSIFGGSAESIALWFKSKGHEDWFYYYLTGMIAISLVVYLFMRDTKHHSAMHRHE